jgi:hypothetical protein
MLSPSMSDSPELDQAASAQALRPVDLYRRCQGSDGHHNVDDHAPIGSRPEGKKKQT